MGKCLEISVTRVHLTQSIPNVELSRGSFVGGTVIDLAYLIAECQCFTLHPQAHHTFRIYISLLTLISATYLIARALLQVALYQRFKIVGNRI